MPQKKKATRGAKTARRTQDQPHVVVLTCIFTVLSIIFAVMAYMQRVVVD